MHGVSLWGTGFCAGWPIPIDRSPFPLPSFCSPCRLLPSDGVGSRFGRMRGQTVKAWPRRSGRATRYRSSAAMKAGPATSGAFAPSRIGPSGSAYEVLPITAGPCSAARPIGYPGHRVHWSGALPSAQAAGRRDRAAERMDQGPWRWPGASVPDGRDTHEFRRTNRRLACGSSLACLCSTGRACSHHGASAHRTPARAAADSDLAPRRAKRHLRLR